jgi:hypothetical protein
MNPYPYPDPTRSRQAAANAAKASPIPLLRAVIPLLFSLLFCCFLDRESRNINGLMLIAFSRFFSRAGAGGEGLLPTGPIIRSRGRKRWLRSIPVARLWFCERLTSARI